MNEKAGFSKQAISAIRCSLDRGELRLVGKSEDDPDVIFNGTLACANCGEIYKIQEGVLDLLSVAANDLPLLLRDEIRSRDQAAKDYDKRLASRHDKEIPSTIKEFPSIEGAKIIEYGCGTGRLTDYLRSARLIVASDFSRASLALLGRKFSGAKNLALVLADVSVLKTTSGFFDWALATQVLEHIPAPRRFRFLQSVRCTLIRGGIFVSTSYYFDWRRRFKRLPREGRHASGIFYHYFLEGEIKNELSRMFKIKCTKLIDITLPLEARFNLSSKVRGLISFLAERLPLARQFGHLILARVENDEPKGLHYRYGLFGHWGLSKHWYWFTDPQDVSGAAMVNFFSYHLLELPGFQRRLGRTTVINLAFSEEEIWRSFRPKFICKQIEKGRRQGIVVKKDENYREFRKIYRAFRRDRGLARDSLRAIRGKADLFCAYLDGEMLAGGVFVSDGIHSRALILASRQAKVGIRRELVGQANRLVIWEALKYAKESGHEEFDLGGISPDSPDPHLRSLAEFKEAFGGERRDNFYYFKVYSRILKWWLRFRGFKNV